MSPPVGDVTVYRSSLVRVCEGETIQFLSSKRKKEMRESEREREREREGGRAELWIFHELKPKQLQELQLAFLFLFFSSSFCKLQLNTYSVAVQSRWDDGLSANYGSEATSSVR